MPFCAQGHSVSMRRSYGCRPVALTSWWAKAGPSQPEPCAQRGIRGSVKCLNQQPEPLPTAKTRKIGLQALPRVLRKKGIHVVSDSIADFMADGSHFIQPG